MLQRWDRLTFLHWRFDIDTVQALLPTGLEVEPFDGYAWVGLVPFYMEVSIPRLGRIPWLFNFPETNVRTYVRGPSGDAGVWFFSLDAARLAAVVTARSTYRVPYFWSRMDVRRRGDSMTYSTRRRWPGPRGRESRIEVEIGHKYTRDRAHRFRSLSDRPMDSVRNLGRSALDGPGSTSALAPPSGPVAVVAGWFGGSSWPPDANDGPDRPLVPRRRRPGWVPVVHALNGEGQPFLVTTFPQSNSQVRVASR